MGEWLQVGPAGNRAYLAVPEGGAGAGVLVLHAWWGLTSVFTDVCDRLAAAGFVALAPSLYRRRGDGRDHRRGRSVGRRARSSAGRGGGGRAGRGRAAARVAGGDRCTRSGSSASRWAPTGRCICRRCGRTTSARSWRSTGRTTAITARRGPPTSVTSRSTTTSSRWRPCARWRTRIRAAGREVTFHVYPGTGHWFVEPNRPDVYNAAAAELVWERTLAFLKAQLA